MTLYVQDRFEGFDVTGAYAISVLLAVFAMQRVARHDLPRPQEARRT